MIGPRVSVVICTYNAGDYLLESIGSALAQTYRDIEVIVLDNASTDHTPELVKRFNDPRFRYIRNETNLGFVGNVNKGLSIAAGEFVNFLGADDIWEIDYLERAIQLFDSHPNAYVCHSVVTIIDPQGRKIGLGHVGWAEVTPAKEAFLNCYLYGFTFAATIARTQRLRELGPLDVNWRDISDTWLFLTLALEGEVLTVTDPRVRYRVHDASISLSMYRTGEMFRQRIATTREALGWKKTIETGADDYRSRVLRQIAIESIRLVHLCRFQDSRITFLKLFWQIVREVPSVLLLLSTWIRLVFGMMPRSVIRWLRDRRNKRTLEENSSTSMEQIGAAT